MIITIKRNDTNEFIATLPGVTGLDVRQGSATIEGPFLTGIGKTPSEALNDLYENIGEAYLLNGGVQ